MKKRKSYASGFKTKVVLEVVQERDDIQLLLDEKTVIISNWIIECNFTNNGESLISVVNNKTGVSLKYCESENEGSTQIVDIVNSEKKELSLCDEFPNIEI